MKWWNSAFNARGRRLILVLVQLREVKIYVAAVEALRKKKRQDETEFSTNIDGFLIFIPRWVLIYFFANFILISHCVWPNLGFWCCLFLTLWITLSYIEHEGISHICNSVWEENNHKENSLASCGTWKLKGTL